MESSGEHKRHREVESVELESPEVKRLRADLFFDILDDDAGAGDQDLDSVIKSLEEEIALPSPPPEPQLQQEPSDAAVGQPDLGYLFEASDDELGLPPTAAQSSADEGGVAAEAAVAGAVVETEGAGFGQIWGFDDEIDGYEGFGLVIRPEEREVLVEDGLVFDGGLFDYADEISGSYDLSDLSWRSESLPAV